MQMQKIFNLVIAIIVIIGAINWGAVAGFNMDLVRMMTPGQADVERYIKMAVGLAGIYHAFQLYSKLSDDAEAEKSA